MVCPRTCRCGVASRPAGAPTRRFLWATRRFHHELHHSTVMIAGIEHRIARFGSRSLTIAVGNPHLSSLRKRSALGALCVCFAIGCRSSPAIRTLSSRSLCRGWAIRISAVGLILPRATRWRSRSALRGGLLWSAIVRVVRRCCSPRSPNPSAIRTPTPWSNS